MADLGMGALEIASVDPSWVPEDGIPHAREWHPLTKVTSDEARRKEEGHCMFFHNECVYSMDAAKKDDSCFLHRKMAPVDLELMRFEKVHGGRHMLVRPCGHMVIQVSVVGNTITAMGMGGNILVTKTFSSADHVRAYEFKQLCIDKLMGLNKLSQGSTLHLVRAGEAAHLVRAGEFEQPAPLHGNLVLKVGVPRPRLILEPPSGSRRTRARR
jgi:hypothetical protein